MIEEIVTVIANEGKLAVVEAQRQSTCGSCDAKSSCGTSVLAKAFGSKTSRIRVNNPIGAAPGERVVIGVEDDALPKASFLFYIVPLMTLFLGSLLGEQVALQFSLISTEPAAIFSGLLGLLVGLISVRRFAARSSNKNQYEAVILRRADPFQIQLGNN